MKQSPTRVFLIIVLVFLGCFGVAYGATGMLTALPAPAIGGTCGPSTASETALQALTQPGSIGAGPQPPKSNVTAHRQWQTFIDQCQDLADRRGLASLAITVISISAAGAGLFWIYRKRQGEEGDAGVSETAQFGRPEYALAGAGAVASGAGPTGTWTAAPQPGYGRPSPPHAATYPEAGYPQQGWPGQPQGYPPAPQFVYPPAPAYPLPNAYPAAQSPMPPPPLQGTPPQAPPPQPPTPPTSDHGGQALDSAE